MIQTFDLSSYFVFFARGLIFTLFLVSVFPKIQHVAAFENTISSFKLLPRLLIKLAAWVFIFLELATVIVLLVGGEVLIFGFLIGIFTLLVFTGALITVLLRGMQMHCNCFGKTNHNVSIKDVMRNVFIISIGLLGVFYLFSGGNQPAQLSTSVKIILGLMAGNFALIFIKLDDFMLVLIGGQKGTKRGYQR
jgi:hypothetical protein